MTMTTHAREDACWLHVLVRGVAMEKEESACLTFILTRVEIIIMTHTQTYTHDAHTCAHTHTWHTSGFWFSCSNGTTRRMHTITYTHTPLACLCKPNAPCNVQQTRQNELGRPGKILSQCRSVLTYVNPPLRCWLLFRAYTLCLPVNDGVFPVSPPKSSSTIACVTHT